MYVEHPSNNYNYISKNKYLGGGGVLFIIMHGTRLQRLQLTTIVIMLLNLELWIATCNYNLIIMIRYMLQKL